MFVLVVKGNSMSCWVTGSSSCDCCMVWYIDCIVVSLLRFLHKAAWMSTENSIDYGQKLVLSVCSTTWVVVDQKGLPSRIYLEWVPLNKLWDKNVPHKSLTHGHILDVSWRSSNKQDFSFFFFFSFFKLDSYFGKLVRFCNGYLALQSELQLQVQLLGSSKMATPLRVWWKRLKMCLSQKHCSCSVILIHSSQPAFQYSKWFLQIVKLFPTQYSLF